MWKQANQCTGAWLANSLSIVRIVTLSGTQTNTHTSGRQPTTLQSQVSAVVYCKQRRGLSGFLARRPHRVWIKRCHLTLLIAGKKFKILTWKLTTCVLMSTLCLVFASWLLLCCGQASLTKWKQGALRRSCSPAAENSSLIVSLPRCSSVPVSYIIPKWQAHSVILGDPPNCRSQYDSSKAQMIVCQVWYTTHAPEINWKC